jgi:cell wall-associated NlpC family hydrolase
MIRESDWVVVIRHLVGTPFGWNARGPDAYDCWGLVIEARRSLGLPTPDVWSEWLLEDGGPNSYCVMDAESKRDLWVRNDNPEAGDIVAMSTHKLIHHVGLNTPFGVLNTTRELGATVDSRQRLRELGYKRIEYFKWVG